MFIQKSTFLKGNLKKKIVYKFCTYLLLSVYQSGNIIWSEEQIFYLQNYQNFCSKLLMNLVMNNDKLNELNLLKQEVQ